MFLSVVNEKNQFVTGRQYSKLVTISVLFDGNYLTLSSPNFEPIEVDLPEDSNEIETEVFGQKCSGIDLGPEVGAWISNFLEKPHLKFKLIYHEYSEGKSNRQLQDLNMELRPLTKVINRC